MAMLSQMLPGDVSAMIGAAQPRQWPRLGDEVDIDCNNQFCNAMFSSADPLQKRVSQRLQKAVDPLIDIKNAIEGTLMARVTDPEVSWLVFSSTSLHGIADNFAAMDALLRLGVKKIDPRRFDLAKAALFCAGSMYAFEKVCFVCDRPESVSNPQDGPHPRVTTLKFRDGFEAHNQREEQE
jgi:hypothetical protein